MLEEGVHSGAASGIVPSSFRIFRQLLTRLEDEDTGEIRPEALYAQIPAERVAQARVAAAGLGERVYSEFPFVAGMKPAAYDLTELVLNRTGGRNSRSPASTGFRRRHAGNVLLPYTTAKLSLRPPTLDPVEAVNTGGGCSKPTQPYGAKVEFESATASAGWNAPALAPWLEPARALAERRAAGLYGRGRHRL